MLRRILALVGLVLGAIVGFALGALTFVGVTLAGSPHTRNAGLSAEQLATRLWPTLVGSLLGFAGGRLVAALVERLRR